jgi:hypothetical protein
LLHLGQGFALLLFVNDRVTAKHGVGLVAGDFHGDGLRYASGDHIAGSCAAQIME